MAVTGFSPSFRALASPTTHSHTKTVLPLRPYISIGGSRNLQFCSLVAADTGSGVSATAADEAAVSSNGSVVTAVADDEPAGKNGFHDARWKGGTWDLTQFTKDGQTNWDAVIDAEVKRRKWMEDNPQSSSNEDPVTFDTSIVPWWAWMKRFHLPEAELLNGRAAMIGFFMAYIVDGLTGVGLVDQMENFFCKTLLLVTVGGVLLIRKNQDIETIKKLVEETTFYDKQWQASWQDETQSSVAEKQND